MCKNNNNIFGSIDSHQGRVGWNKLTPKLHVPVYEWIVIIPLIWDNIDVIKLFPLTGMRGLIEKDDADPTTLWWDGLADRVVTGHHAAHMVVIVLEIVIEIVIVVDVSNEMA